LLSVLSGGAKVYKLNLEIVANRQLATKPLSEIIIPLRESLLLQHHVFHLRGSGEANRRGHRFYGSGRLVFTVSPTADSPLLFTVVSPVLI
jgi:hypothetical protein